MDLRGEGHSVKKRNSVWNSIVADSREVENDR